jgi:hypothetical protein
MGVIEGRECRIDRLRTRNIDLESSICRDVKIESRIKSWICERASWIDKGAKNQYRTKHFRTFINILGNSSFLSTLLFFPLFP